MREKRFFKKLYRTSLFTIAVGILLSFVLLSVTSYRMLLAELSRKNSTYVSQIAAGVDNKLKNVINAVNRMKINAKFQEFVKLDTVDYYQLCQMQEAISSYAVDLPEQGGNAFAYIEKFDMVVSGYQTFTLSTFLRQYKSTLTAQQFTAKEPKENWQKLPLEDTPADRMVFYTHDMSGGEPIVFFIVCEMSAILPAAEAGGGAVSL